MLQKKVNLLFCFCFFCLLDLKFSNSIYTAFTFFFSVCFYAVHSDYCCYPRLMFFSLLLLNVLYSLLCMCAFSHSLFFLFRVSQLDLDLVLSQKMPAPTIPNSQQIAKKDSQEKELPLSYSHLPSLSFILKRADARARKKRECAETLRTCEPTIDRRTDPEIANESKREHLMRYLRDIRLPDYSLLRPSFSFFLAFLSSLLPYRTRGGRDEHFDSLIPKKHKTRQIATTTTTKESVRARRLIDHVRRRRCRNKKTRQLVCFLMVFLRSRTTINYDLFLINSNSLPVKYNHYNYVCVVLFCLLCFASLLLLFIFEFCFFALKTTLAKL